MCIQIHKLRMESCIIHLKSFLKNPIEGVVHIFRNYRPFRFIVSGGTAAVLHISLAFVFTDIFGIWYLYSSIIAFLCAVGVGFVLQKHWTFQDKEVDGTHLQFLKYGTTSGTALLANAILMYSLVDILDLWYLYAQVLTSGTIAIGNYFIYKYLIFNRVTAQNQ